MNKRTVSAGLLSLGLVGGVAYASSATSSPIVPDGATVSKLASRLPAVAAADRNGGAPKPGARIALARLTKIAEELPVGARNVVAPAEIGTSADGAPILVSAGTSGVCLVIAGNASIPGGSSCFSPESITKGTAVSTTYLGDGQVRVDALTPTGVDEVDVRTRDGASRKEASASGVASFITTNDSAVGWTEPTGRRANVRALIR